MPESHNFQMMRGMMIAHHPCYAKYRRDTTARKLCPHVIGYIDQIEDTTTERVLCYQLEGADHNPGLLCFNLNEIHIESQVNDGWITPENYFPDWQNSMKNPKHRV